MNVTTHVGKIGRLPKSTRDCLGERIENGESGQKLVEWLNSLNIVKETLKEHFDGRPITEQNISDWRRNGHQLWLRHQETKRFAASITEQSEDLDEAADGHELSDRFATVLATEIARLGQSLLEQEPDPEKRWQRLCAINRELSQLRRDDHRALRTLIRRQQWTRQVEREDTESEKQIDKEHRERLCAPLWAQLQLNSYAELFGGGERGKDIAAFILEMSNNLPAGKLGRNGGEEREDSKVSKMNKG